jgi:hypothetical protein
MKMAILWAANSQVAGPDMPFEEADVDSNRKVIDQLGATYWDSKAKRMEIREPLNGYIYIACEKIVRHKCRLEQMINRKTLLKIDGEQQYVPEFRKQCLCGRFSDGRRHETSETWIKILKIESLKSPFKLGELKKWSNGKAVKLVRAPIYIRDPG